MRGFLFVECGGLEVVGDQYKKKYQFKKFAKLPHGKETKKPQTKKNKAGKGPGFESQRGKETKKKVLVVLGPPFGVPCRPPPKQKPLNWSVAIMFF